MDCQQDETGTGSSLACEVVSALDRPLRHTTRDVSRHVSDGKTLQRSNGCGRGLHKLCAIGDSHRHSCVAYVVPVLKRALDRGICLLGICTVGVNPVRLQMCRHFSMS